MVVVAARRQPFLQFVGSPHGSAFQQEVLGL
jgi:hypothetical protein